MLSSNSTTSNRNTWERAVLFALISPHEMSPIFTALAEEKANVSHFISVFHVHVASQPCACKYSFPDNFFLFFLLKVCITLSNFLKNLNKMQLYRNFDGSQNSKLLVVIEMKDIEKKIIKLLLERGNRWSGGRINTGN